MNVIEKLTLTFQKVFDDNSIILNPSMTADDIDAWDSLSHVNLLIAIELDFGIEFNPREIQTFANVGDLIHSIEEKLGAVDKK